MNTDKISPNALFPSEIIDLWLKNSPFESYKKGSVISSNTISDSSLFLMKKGQASIQRTHLDGKDCVVGIVKSREFLNIYDIFSSLKSNMSFKAITSIEVAVVNKSMVVDYVLKRPEQSRLLLQYFSDSLQEMSEMLSHIAYGKVEERIMFLFSKIAENNNDDEDWLKINQIITHQDIASMIGSTRETVNVVIHKLISRGYMKQSKETNCLYINKNYLNTIDM